MKTSGFLVIALALLMAAPAFACATLESAQPRVGSSVSGPVRQVTLKFSMQVFPTRSTLDVTDETGARVSTGPAFDPGPDNSVIATHVGVLPPGKYKVRWNVLAACGSKEPGDYKFTVR